MNGFRHLAVSFFIIIKAAESKSNLMGEESKLQKTSNKKPFYKKWWFWAIIVLILIGIYGAKEEMPKKTGGNADSSQVSQDQTTFKIGDVISYKNKEITVQKIERNYNTGNQFSKPKDGKEFVRVHILIENKSDDKMSYNAFNWEMQDSTGDIKSYSWVTDDTHIGSGDLAKGGKKVGTIVFEVPKDDKALTLHYKDSFFSNKTIEIKL